MIILPGGVTHAFAGLCIATIIVPVIPIVPLSVKNPPLITLFIMVFSFYGTPNARKDTFYTTAIISVDQIHLKYAEATQQGALHPASS